MHALRKKRLGSVLVPPSTLARPKPKSPVFLELGFVKLGEEKTKQKKENTPPLASGRGAGADSTAQQMRHAERSTFCSARAAVDGSPAETPHPATARVGWKLRGSLHEPPQLAVTAIDELDHSLNSFLLRLQLSVLRWWQI